MNTIVFTRYFVTHALFCDEEMYCVFSVLTIVFVLVLSLLSSQETFLEVFSFFFYRIFTNYVLLLRKVSYFGFKYESRDGWSRRSKVGCHWKTSYWWIKLKFGHEIATLVSFYFAVVWGHSNILFKSNAEFL